ncbi:extracellular solute-binding protein [Neobacillus dielmonensis]|uniref:extracellular solute-binding protein n=1 Tax=Neobacillus dielmonensis TaxID=1347369 RepID=UPI0005A6C3FA|nr:extracellular solute-binding protein [Neobacillus dielmonensis]
MSGKKSRDIFKEQLNKMVSTVRQQIFNGEIALGEYLPSELILAEQFDLSKNSVRKGLEELVEEGLIVKKSRIGNQVISNQSFDQTILRVGYYPSLISEAQFPVLIRKFEQNHPTIKVQTIALPYDHYQQTVHDFFQNDLIDVATINHKDFMEFPDYYDIFEEQELEKELYPFLQQPFKSLMNKNKVYVRPFIFSPIVLCYNKGHFDESQLPYPDSGWSWDEALDAAKGLMLEQGRACGLYFHPLSFNRWPIFMLQNRVEFKQDTAGNIVFPADRMLESAGYIRKTFDVQGITHSFLSDNDRDAEKLFVEKQSSMIVTSYFSLNEISKHSIDYDIAPLPYIKDPGTLLLIIGLAINKYTKKKEAAKQFVDFMTGEMAQEEIRTTTLSIPAMKRVAEKSGSEMVYKPSRFYLFREVIPTFKLYSDLGLSSTELVEMRNELRVFLSDLMDDKIFQQRLKIKLLPHKVSEKVE